MIGSNFTGPNPPEWRIGPSVAYFKGKLYYLGGEDPKTKEDTNRVDVRRSSENPLMIDSKNFTGPLSSEWRIGASVAYFKDKLYYLGGWEPKTYQETNRVDVRRSNKSP